MTTLSSLVLIICLLPSVSLAQWNKIPSAEFELEPPVRSAASQRKEIDVLLKYQSTREDRQCALARSQPYPNFQMMFARSGLFKPQEFQRVKPLMERVMAFSVRVAGYHKKRFSRPRPYQVDDRVQPCAEKPKGSKSYPSSHAASAMTAGCVLAQVFPDRADAFAEYGRYLGELRVISGVHFPSDVAAGQSLGAEICARILDEPDFKKSLSEL